MDFPTEFEIPSEDERYKPIPPGEKVNVKLAERYDKNSESFLPLGDFYQGNDKNGNAFMIVPFKVSGGDYDGRNLSLFVSLARNDRNMNFLAKLYETVTGEDLSEGGSINLNHMVDHLKTGLFEVEVKLQRDDPNYNDIKLLVGRVGDVDRDSTDGVSIDVSDAPDDIPEEDGDVPF